MCRAERQQLLLDQVRDRGLAGAGKAGEPQHARLLALDAGPRRLVHVERLPVDVLRAAQREMHQPGAHGRVGQAVDQDEAARIAVLGIRIERDRLIEREVADADLVQRERLRGEMLERVDVDLVLRLRDRRRDDFRADLHPVRASRQHRLVGHPDDRDVELVRDPGWPVGRREYVATAHVDLVLERDRDRLAGDRLLEIAVHRDDPRHPALAARGQHPQLLARHDDTAHDGAREAAEVEIGSIHPLHRHPERPLLQLVLDLDGLEVSHQRRPVVPGRVVARAGDVVALEARHRDRDDVLQLDALGERGVLRDDALEDVLRVVDEVHLVDRQHHLADAEQRHEVAVAARLHEHALARVDQDHGEVGGRGPGDHVARVLLVARRVGDDELALVGREEAVRHVDRDALLALRREPVDQQREVEVAALRADLLRVGLERRKLVLEDHLRVVEQAPDQRRLAVVDAAAGDEAQQALVLVRVEVGLDVLLDQVRDVSHQKYPSCFFFSIDADWSWSMTRPWRSELVVSSISWMIAGSVSASLSTAPVSG